MPVPFMNVAEGDNSPNQKAGPPKTTLKDVIAAIVGEGVEFYVNTKLEPVVFLPDTPFQKYWPAGHNRVQCYLAAVYYDLSQGGTLKPTDLAAIIALLTDACYKGGRCLTELESPETEKDPIVQAILAYMNGSESFEGMTATLLKKLKEPTILRATWDYEGLPALPNIFSRKLNRLIPALRGLGIDVSIWHEEDGSHCKVKRLPHFVKETDALNRQSSVEASAASPKTGRHFAAADASERFDDDVDTPQVVDLGQPIPETAASDTLDRPSNETLGDDHSTAASDALDQSSSETLGDDHSAENGGAACQG